MRDCHVERTHILLQEAKAPQCAPVTVVPECVSSVAKTCNFSREVRNPDFM